MKLIDINENVRDHVVQLADQISVIGTSGIDLPQGVYTV